MKLAAVPLLADENINPDVIAGAAALGLDVVAVTAVGLIGHSDTDEMRYAIAQSRAVLTHTPTSALWTSNRVNLSLASSIYVRDTSTPP